jgi:hypothetical protein
MSHSDNLSVLSSTFGAEFYKLYKSLPDNSLIAIWLQFGSPEPELVYCLPEESCMTPLEVRSLDGVRKGIRIYSYDVLRAIKSALPFTCGAFINAFHK